MKKKKKKLMEEHGTKKRRWWWWWWKRAHAIQYVSTYFPSTLAYYYYFCSFAIVRCFVVRYVVRWNFHVLCLFMTFSYKTTHVPAVFLRVNGWRQLCVSVGTFFAFLYSLRSQFWFFVNLIETQKCCETMRNFFFFSSVFFFKKNGHEI